MFPIYIFHQHICFSKVKIEKKEFEINMEDGSPIWGLIIFIIFLIVHAILYGFESAIQNLNESDLISMIIGLNIKFT